ncbi:uncharacterized protein isoform X2 [Salmo salar]|uniref:Uncharacterized protein isoform X2 n=1 Tax=Salmo salar TaxID=8030 RepID=A0A1S3Q753_SALSA|nr:uncharacterized protein LOC106589855 isoform X2 [Salmo salar]|eukprot:XP_014035727.1 PREDICTED: uncharacterized protein LOC106589855 [Salmo salar]
MSLSASTNIPPALTADQLTVIVASVSCLVFFVVILVLLVVLYRKDPFCCRVSNNQHCTDAPPQYNRRQSLVVSPYDERTAAMAHGNIGSQLPGRLFIIGKPSSYHLDGILPRLPSYESVRKKDRQRQIHSMIANRFGISPTQSETEPPPTYEETLRQSMIISSEDLQSVEARPSDLPLSTSTSSLEHTVTVARSPYHPIQSPTQEPLSV